MKVFREIRTRSHVSATGDETAFFHGDLSNDLSCYISILQGRELGYKTPLTHSPHLASGTTKLPLTITRPLTITTTTTTMADATTTIDTALASIKASPKTLQVLRDLHQQALAEPAFVSTAQPITSAIDKFVALDPDKCAIVYLLLRSSGARFVVEAGTSFGVSTIYLALAVGQNAAAAAAPGGSSSGKVIATENEPTKSAKARAHWKAIGDEVEPWIDLREGDLRETLRSDLPAQIDFVLLDSESAPPFTCSHSAHRHPGGIND